MTDLQVNLFDAFLPSEVELLIRDRPDKLLFGEAELGESDPKLSVLVAHGLAPLGSFKKSFPTYDLRPPLIQRLIVEGLANSFPEKFLIERELLSFSIFDSKDKVKVDAEFIDLLRGVSFRAEHVTSQGKSYYGFFVSMKVRRKFNDSVDRGLLLQAAVGEQVRIVRDGRAERVKLVEVKDNSAKVETREFETKDVAADELEVSAAQGILGRYAHSIGRPEVTSRLIVDSQVASFRYNATGTRVRTWLKAEMNFIGSWLARLSQAGRLPFTLPNSASECYVGIRTAVAKEQTR